MSAFHGQQTTADGIHVLPRYTFNTPASMIAAAYTAADEGCCIQVGAAAPYTYYIMKDASNSGDLALGYVELAAGTGNFNGPAGATAGNAISFADATGNVGADSGKAAANIPSALPIQIGEGGTGQTSQQAAMEALSVPTTGQLWVNADYTGTSNGSVNAPYTSIQDALPAIGPSSSVADEQEGWEVNVGPGFYDENLVIPENRNIAIRAEGLAVLSDTALATTRSITLSQTVAPSWPVTKYVVVEGLFMSGSITLTSVNAGGNVEFTTRRLDWINSAYAGACVDATGWVAGPILRFYMDSCRLVTAGADAIISNTTHVGADVALAQVVRCDIDKDITIGGYSQLQLCRFAGKHSYKAASAVITSNAVYPQGYISCSWDTPATATIDAQSAGDFRVDGMSFRKSEGITFVGSVAFTSDPYQGMSNPYLPLTGASWAASTVDQQNMKKAIDRLATAVNGLLGGGGIP